MAKSQADKTNTYLKIIVSIIAIVGAIIAVNSYFAKTKDVEQEIIKFETNDHLLNERLDISITDDQIFQQQQQIQQMEIKHTFEQKAQVPELTPMEKEALEQAQKRLKKLEEEKAAKIKKYDEMRMKK